MKNVGLLLMVITAALIVSGCPFFGIHMGGDRNHNDGSHHSREWHQGQN